MKRIISLLVGVSLVLLVVGCHIQTDNSKKTANKVVPKKTTVIFKPGIPDKLKGTYYRAEVSKMTVSDDEFFKLKLADNSLHLQKIGSDYDEIDFSKISYLKISDDTYIVKSDDRYLKVVLSPDQKMSLSKEPLDNKREASSDRHLLTFTKTKPDGYFGITADQLEGHCYLSDWDGLKYYSFNDLPIGNFLMQVDQQGKDHLIKNYRVLRIKLDGYRLTNPYEDAETLLLPISKTQLKDVKTGETFTRYDNEYEMKQNIRQSLGLGPEKTIITPMPSEDTKKATSPKTYDFADDQDDDYYDTYDDFDLNNGD